MSKRNEKRRKEERDLRKDVDVQNALNREQNKNIERAFRQRNVPNVKRLNGHVDKLMSGMKKGMKDDIKVAKNCTPQMTALVKLTDDPFNAKWEDVKYPRYPGGLPIKSTVIRMYGTLEIAVPVNSATQIYFQPNPNVQAAVGLSPAHTNKVTVSAVDYGIPGCPSYEAGASTLDGNCGYVTPGVTLAAASTFNTSVTAGDPILGWNTPAQLADMVADDSGLFAFRLVAAGIQGIPTGKALDLGGLIRSARIPEATNDGYNATQKMMGNSTAHYERGGQSFQHNYHRSELDETWVYPTSNAGSAVCPSRRSIIVITNPDSVAVSTYLLQYVAYYEVIGQAANTVGTMSYSQPEMTAKFSTAQSLMAQDDQRATVKETERAMEVVHAQEHVAIGPIVAGANTHKSVFKKIEDFVETVSPIAKKVVEGVASVAAFL